MVKKLIKHEFASYLKVTLVIDAILLSVALITRILQFFESDSNIYNILFGSSVVAFVIAIIASMILTLILIIARFYKNLFTNEGYLTLTLPVTHSKHILTKLLCAVTYMLMNVVAIIVSIMVATAGEVCAEIFKAIFYLLKRYFEAVGGNATLYIIEVVLVVLVSLASNVLLFYACIAIGQMSKKSRVAKAVLVYYIYYIICQVFGTILIAILDQNSQIFAAIGKFAFDHPYGFVHILLLSVLVIEGALGVLYFFITHRIMHKKLNVE